MSYDFIRILTEVRISIDSLGVSCTIDIYHKIYAKTKLRSVCLVFLAIYKIAFLFHLVSRRQY